MMMKDKLAGRVVRLPFDDVNTDIIVPGEFRLQVADDDHNLTALRPHVFRAIRPGLDSYVKPGDIFVVGKNFGCGSHREPAVQIFKVWGVQAIVAESAARIWFRNAIAAGIPVFDVENATKLFSEGQGVEIDMQSWTIRNTDNGEERSIASFPDTVMNILNAGGILSLLKTRVETQFAPKFGLSE
jgi:3-isopropylmalate/(R)-2-methylmalate dehydratase small subunit